MSNPAAKHLRTTWDDLAHVFRHSGIISGVFFAGFTAISMPAQLAVALMESVFERRTRVRHLIIEIWILIWLGTEIVAISTTRPYLVLIVLILMRLADMLATLARAMLLDIPIWNRPRSLIHLVVHYAEVVLVFAALYWWLDSCSPSPLFLIQNHNVPICASKSFLFSLATASTIGFGDIVPVASSYSLSLLERPSTFIALEVFSVIFISAISIPRYFTARVRGIGAPVHIRNEDQLTFPPQSAQ